MKKVGVIGCGAISDIFFKNMIHSFGNLEVVACSSRSMVSAEKKAAEYGIKAVSIEELLNDPQIDIVVNLTPAGAHYEVIRSALEHGKHVYTEKVICPSCEEAKELAKLADEKGLLLCSAPDTYMGAAVQTAKKAVEAGEIGRVSSAHASFNRDIARLHEYFKNVVEPGAGAGFDQGIYYLTAMLSILGPVKKEAGTVRTNEPKRTFDRPESRFYGQSYEIRNENVMTGVLDFACGTQATVNFNTDCIFPTDSQLTFYGTRGILYLPAPDGFGGDVVIHRSSTRDSEILPCTFAYGEGDMRGLGVSDMADAIEQGRAPRAGKEMAIHAIEVLEGIVKSSASGSWIHMETGFEIPALMPEQN